MASIVTSVLKATVGLLITKGRDAAAERLMEGDVTDEQFRNMIVRELDDIKSKLDGLARKDLLTSISFFKEGIVFLYQALDKKTGGEGRAATARAEAETEEDKSQPLCLQSVTAAIKTVSLVRGQGIMQLSDLDDTGKRALADAKKRFDDARMKATEAFNNVAISTADRILAMRYRVMSTILEKIDNPREAIPACKLCLEELHSMPAVEKSVLVQKTGGVRSLFKKDERKEITDSVYDVNRVACRVTALVDGLLSKEFDSWPYMRQDVDIHPWSFGEAGEGKLQCPRSITSTSQGDFIVADKEDIKFFNQRGEFLYSTNHEAGCVKDVTTDDLDNLYLLMPSQMHVFDKQAKLRRSFKVGGEYKGISVTVNEDRKVFVLVANEERRSAVQVYNTDGMFVSTFGINMLVPKCIPAIRKGGIMIFDKWQAYRGVTFICMFDAQGKLIGPGRICPYRLPDLDDSIALHSFTDQVIVASLSSHSSIVIQIYRQGRQGNHQMRKMLLNTVELDSISAMTVTLEGQIALLCTLKKTEHRSYKHVVYVV